MLLASTSCASSSSSLSVTSELTSAPFCSSCSWHKRSFKVQFWSQQWQTCQTQQCQKNISKMMGERISDINITFIEAIFARRFSSIWPLPMWNGRSKTSCNKTAAIITFSFYCENNSSLLNLLTSNTVFPPKGDCERSLSSFSLVVRGCLDEPFRKPRISSYHHDKSIFQKHYQFQNYICYLSIHTEMKKYKLS